MRSFLHFTFSLLVAFCLVGFVGCNSGDTKSSSADTSHDAHDEDDHADEHGDDHVHPETYEEAVAMFAELETKIRDAVAKDGIDAAHDHLHDVGHALEDIEAVVKSSDLDEEGKKAVAAAVATLFASFGSVDDKLHGEDGKEYDEVADDIAAAVKTLQDHVSHSADGDSEEASSDEDKSADESPEEAKAE